MKKHRIHLKTTSPINSRAFTVAIHGTNNRAQHLQSLWNFAWSTKAQSFSYGAGIRSTSFLYRPTLSSYWPNSPRMLLRLIEGWYWRNRLLTSSTMKKESSSWISIKAFRSFSISTDLRSTSISATKFSIKKPKGSSWSSTRGTET